MKNRIRAHYTRNQPFYEVAAIGSFWITLLIAAFILEANIK